MFKKCLSLGAAVVLLAGVTNLYAFTAPDQADLITWLDAGSGVTTDGSGGVVNWADKSGNGNDASPMTSSKPTLISNGINGLPSISLSGGSDILQTAYSAGNITGMSVFIVARDHAGVPAWQQNGIIGATSDGYGGASKFFVIEPDYVDGTNDTYLGEFNYDSTYGGPALTGGAYGSAAHAYSLVWQGGLTNFYNNTISTSFMVNGVTTSALSGQNSSPKAGVWDEDFELPFTIGGIDHFGNLYGDAMDVSEVLIYDTALSAQDAAAVNSYLYQKYNITPEPATMALLGLGAISLLRRRMAK